MEGENSPTIDCGDGYTVNLRSLASDSWNVSDILGNTLIKQTGWCWQFPMLSFKQDRQKDQ